MIECPCWQRDEMMQPGVNYADPVAAAAYDARHARFRDFEPENEGIMRALELRPEQTLLDMGAGTGRLAVAAARRCARVYAVDVSEAMLAVARRRAGDAGVSNIEFHHGGFLTYQHAAAPVDAIVSQAALHHLPDMWKVVALTRLAAILRPGGRLYLMDVVFSFDPAGYESFFDTLLRRAAETVDEEMASDWARHVREEYSTVDWVMEGMLQRSGFAIEKADYSKGTIASYLCTRV